MFFFVNYESVNCIEKELINTKTYLQLFSFGFGAFLFVFCAYFLEIPRKIRNAVIILNEINNMHVTLGEFQEKKQKEIKTKR